MCTSTDSKPARSNAAAISTWPFTPCSRRMATRGRASVETENGFGIEGQSNRKPGIVRLDDAVVFLARARPGCRAASACGSVVSLQMRCRWSRLAVNTRPVVARDADLVARVELADDVRVLAEAGRAQRRHHPVAVGGADLQHRAELLGEQRVQREVLQPPGELLVGVALEGVDVVRRGIEGERVEAEGHAAVAGERHLADRGEQPAVGAVVVGEQQWPQLLHRRRRNSSTSAGSSRSGHSLAELRRTPARGSSRRGGSCPAPGRPAPARSRRRRCEAAA